MVGAAFSLLAAGVVGGSTPAPAGHTITLAGSNFEIDTNANLTVDHVPPAPSFDWGNVNEQRQADAPSGQSDDSFGNGTKEDTAVPSVVSGAIPPNKSDLLNFGVHAEQNSSGNFLHVFWHRVQEPTGTTNMDFEFNQSGVLTSNGVTPVRTGGDMLIQYDLSQGGVNPILSLSIWEATGAKSLCEAANSTPCWGKKQPLSSVGEATGSINSSAILAGDSDGLGNVSVRTFGEASIDFDYLVSRVSNGNPCVTFGSAYLKSRASDSFTAALKDFIAPMNVNLTNCGSLKIVKHDQDGAALSGAKFKVYKDDGDGVAELGGQDVQVGSECTTGADGTGTCTYGNLLIGDKFWVEETHAPAGYGVAGTNPVLVEITATTVHTVTFVNNLLVGELTVVKKDDAGVLMNGITFSLSVGTVPPTCVTGVTNSDGSSAAATPGTCKFLNVPHGTYTLAEVGGVPTGYAGGFSQSNVTISNTPVTVNVTNPRLHRVIVIVCHEGDDTLLTRDVVGPTAAGTPTTTTKASVGSLPAALVARGVTQKELCDLGGASFGGLGHGDRALTAKVAAH